MSEVKPTVAERLSNLLATGKYNDIEFVFENGDKMKGHKLIFAIASPVFEAMMYGSLAENENEIKIDDIEPNGFKTMTEFIYSDNLQLDSVSHAISVYKAGDKYDLPHLQKKTIEYISSNVQTEYGLEILEFSGVYNIPSTEEMCVKLLQEKTKDVISSDYASKCCVSTLETILNKEKLKISEVELFKLVENWAKYYAEINDVPLDDVKPLLKNIIKKIRFLTMTLTEFLSFPFKSQLLSMEEKHNLLLNLNEPESGSLLENFSDCTTSRDPDKELSFSCSTRNCLIQWKLKVANIKFGEKYLSPSFYVDDNPFKILLLPQILEEDVKYVGLFLHYDSKEKYRDSHWSCRVEYTFKLSVKNKEPIVIRNVSCTFDNKNEVNWGFTKFCKWTDIAKVINDKDDSILIEVDLKKT